MICLLLPDLPSENAIWVPMEEVHPDLNIEHPVAALVDQTVEVTLLYHWFDLDHQDPMEAVVLVAAVCHQMALYMDQVQQET